MDIIRQVGILGGCMFFASIAVAQGINVVVQRNLSNTCTNCPRRGCVVIGNAPLLPPTFSARCSRTLENECAVNMAIGYSRFHIADGIKFPTIKTIPPEFDDISFRPLPYCVGGVCLTNMTARVFAFDAAPAFSSNSLPCTLVSFYSASTLAEEAYVYSLYVNDATGRVGLSIQECSGYMLFLENAMRYPFLSSAECLKQQDFMNRMLERMFPEKSLVVPAVPSGLPAQNRHLLPDLEVNVDDI